jgi:replicative DNA helicase
MSTPGVNQTIEQRLVSAAMIDGVDGFSFAASEGITHEHFADPITRACWRAGALCVAQGTQPDASGIYRALAGLDGEARPSAVEIANISGIEPTTAHLKRLVADVLDLSRRRKLIAAMRRAGVAASDPSLREWSEVWAAVEPELRAAGDITADTRSRTLAEVAAEAKRQLLEPDTRDSVPSLSPHWDEHASPCRGGQLIVIAGRPGAGKSALAGQVAHNIAKSGRMVAFFSLEMSAEEILIRMAKLRVNPAPLFTENVAREIDALGKLKTLRLYEVEHARTAAQIEATARLLSSSPVGLGAIVVDYLQLVTPPAGTGRENREQQVAAMSRAFKLLARTLKVPVFLLAQLNREVEKEKNRRPRLSDLRESGSIEQDADRVWFLYPANPDEGASTEGRIVDVVLFQAKCRNGPAGVGMNLRFDRAGMMFARPVNNEPVL